MKSFYDLLDTNNRLHYTIAVKPLFKTKPPVASITINDETIHDGGIQNTLKHKGSFAPQDSLSLVIKLYGKAYNLDHVSAVVLDSFTVDGYEIKEQITYRSVYEHDSLAEHNTVTDHIGWNGTWKFDAGMPFYHFKHKIENRGWLIKSQ
jgi:hypothetical protein